MRTIFFLFIGIFMLTVVQAQLSTAVPHKWKVTLKVVDDAGQPVAAANALVAYGDEDQKSGLTDANGNFVASHRDKAFDLVLVVSKDGYYSYRQVYNLGWAYQYDQARWNPTQTVVLKKVGKPIAMYARKAELNIPVMDNPIGFDLIQYDWVAPYGKGKQADFIFQTRRRWTNIHNFDAGISLTFPNQGDGFVPAFTTPVKPGEGSALRLPAIAPTNGYISEFSKTVSCIPGEGWLINGKPQGLDNGWGDGHNYYFRVRTKMDARGNIISALYGKIYDDFNLAPITDKKFVVTFTYYLNPTPNSSNVEFDPAKNLLTNVKAYDEARDP